jgi:hypothetical protein
MLPFFLFYHFIFSSPLFFSSYFSFRFSFSLFHIFPPNAFVSWGGGGGGGGQIKKKKISFFNLKNISF